MFDRPDPAASLEDMAAVSACLSRPRWRSCPPRSGGGDSYIISINSPSSEIARMTNTPLPTVKSRLRAARSTLSDETAGGLRMNERMEQEIRRTIFAVSASVHAGAEDRQTPVFTLLRIAASEINAWLLLGLFARALSFGLVSVRHYSTKKHRQTLKTQHYLTVLTIYLTANKSESRCIFSLFKSMDGCT